DHRFLADMVQRITQADRGGGLALARRRRTDRRDKDQLAVGAALQRLQVLERNLGLVVPVGLEMFLGDAELFARHGGDALQPRGVNATRIIIGQSAPLSGSNAELGNDIRTGALAYFRKVNDAGGVHGRKVELLSLDDANQVARAEANSVKLVEETRVFALFGYASATLSRPALPIVEKHGVPFLAPFTGADPMRVFNRHVYNMRASYA